MVSPISRANQHSERDPHPREIILAIIFVVLFDAVRTSPMLCSAGFILDAAFWLPPHHLKGDLTHPRLYMHTL